MNIKIVTENNILGRKTEKLVNEFFDIDKLNIIQDKELIIIISKIYENFSEKPLTLGSLDGG